MRFVAVLNRDGGTLRTLDLEAFCAGARSIFEQFGHTLECRIVAGNEVDKTLRQTAQDDTLDAMIAGGGDGTISTAAGIAFASGMPLGVLPAGTMNLFARALGMPLDLQLALEAIAQGEVSAVDIATANGRPFVHQFGVGVHARLVRIRENMHYRSRIGKMLASLRAIVAAAVNPPRFDVELHLPQGKQMQRVSGIAISNNPLGEGHIHADQLDRGLLGVYVASSMTTGELLRLAVGLLFGTWRASPMVSESEVQAVTMHFPKRKRGARAVVDGELIALDRTVLLEVQPGGLKVVKPVRAEAA